MRVLAVLMVLVVAVVGVFFWQANTGAQMRVESVRAQLLPATEAQETYDRTRAEIASGTFYGRQYQEAEFLMAESFAFLTLTVRMANDGYFPMEWIRLEVAPDASDVLMLAAERIPTLAAKSRGEFEATILTRTGADTNREVTVQYYVLGQPMQATFAMGG